MSRTVHRIRLQGPWEYAWLEGGPEGDRPQADALAVTPGGARSPLLSGQRIRMPVSIQAAFGEVQGRVRFTRRFHSPENLDSDEQVWLVIPELRGRMHIRLNDALLGSVAAPDGPRAQSFAADITSLLQRFNRLESEVEWLEASDLPGGLLSAAVLEIRVDDSEPAPWRSLSPEKS